MIQVVDRVPTYPNRIRITRGDGSAELVTWERADEPTVEGTPINKALFDSIAADIGAGLSANKTIYVSGAGSDVLGDGSQTNPYATIQKAVNSLPKNLNGFDASIHIAPGTYNEDVEVSHFRGGNIYLTGVQGNSVSIRSLRVSFGAVLRVTNIVLSVVGDIFNSAISVNNANLFCSSAVRISGNAQYGIYADYSAACIFGNLEISGTKLNAIYLRHTSMLHVSALSGESNDGVGIRSDSGSQVSHGVSALLVATNTVTTDGGRIYSGAQTEIPKY